MRKKQPLTPVAVMFGVMVGIVFYVFTLPAEAQTYEAPETVTLGVSYKAIVSAYTASEDETDSRPWEMASGKTVYDGAVANNCLKFGTKVVINEMMYVVEDRMNKRYGCDHYDILVESKGEAREFGRQHLSVIVIQ